jgi:uncharacterized membrane protein YfcA
MKRKWPLYILLILLFYSADIYAYERVDNALLMQFQDAINHAVSEIRPGIVSVNALKQKGKGEIWYQSLGSGILIDARGYILTNFHVIEKSTRIHVRFWRSTNNNFPASIVDQNKDFDLAILKVNSMEQFEPARISNSDTIEVGDWILSIGNPFGFHHTVTLGIISDLHRELQIGNMMYHDMIQTDTVINQGNSGGPITDINGNVVGVGTAIYAPSGTYSGLGFAIPINRAKHFYSRITGAIPAALNKPKRKEPVDLNKKMPGNAIHKQFSNCTNCHSITKKIVANVQKKIPHPPVGDCNKCHIMIDERVAGGAVPVAINTAGTTDTAYRSYTDLFQHIILKLTVLILVSSIIFTMLGLGGGFLYVPILISSGVDFHTAATTSLIMITTAQISALYNFYKSDLVDFKLFVALELPTMIGAFAGGMFASNFNIDTLHIIFACALFFASFFMMNDHRIIKGRGLQLGGWNIFHEFFGYQYTVNMMVAIPLTLIVGFSSGMLGLAGGWLTVPIMVVLFNIPMKIAVATSSLMIPVTAFSGFIGHSISGHLNLSLAVSLSIVTIIGAQIGSRLSIDADSNLLRLIFAMILGIVGMCMLI